SPDLDPAGVRRHGVPGVPGERVDVPVLDRGAPASVPKGLRAEQLERLAARGCGRLDGERFPRDPRPGARALREVLRAAVQPVAEPGEERQQADGRPGGDRAVTRWRTPPRRGAVRPRRRAWRGQRGQTTVEWLMIAGLLTTVYIWIGFGVGPGEFRGVFWRIVQVCRVLMNSVKGIGP